MKSVKTVTLTLAIALGFCLPAQAEQLSPEQVKTEIVGKEFQGRKGVMRATLTYKPDGTMAMRSMMGQGAGTWQYSDTGMCVNITSGPRTGEECITFTRLSDGSYEMSNGMRLVPQ